MEYFLVWGEKKEEEKKEEKEEAKDKEKVDSIGSAVLGHTCHVGCYGD